MSNESKDHLPDVIVAEKTGFSIIWIVPLIALAIAGYLIYDTYTKRGEEIEITFKDGSGLVAGKTEIQYLGVQVGIVKSVSLDEKLSQVVVTARLDKSADGLATQGAAYWVVRPEIGIGGIRGLDTLLSGPYIGVEPGDGQTPQTEFTGLPEQPAAGPNEPGLNIILQAEKLGSLKDGDPIYYREFQVGEVDQVSLASDARSVHAHVHIKEDYAPLIRTNTRFWNASGIGMDLSLFGGAKIKTESLSSLLTGGVAFATPDNDAMGGEVQDGAVFKLFDDPEDDWAKWSPTIDLPDTTALLNSQATHPQVAAANGKNATAAETPATTASPDPNNATVANPEGTGEVNDNGESSGQKPSVKLPGPPGRHQ
ncbi:MAG: intermembrane transport protein PqiB [Puniceicoccales bacterium]